MRPRSFGFGCRAVVLRCIPKVAARSRVFVAWVTSRRLQNGDIVCCLDSASKVHARCILPSLSSTLSPVLNLIFTCSAVKHSGRWTMINFMAKQAGLTFFPHVSFTKECISMVMNCVNPTSSLPLAAGTFSHNYLPIILHFFVLVYIPT